MEETVMVDSPSPGPGPTEDKGRRKQLREFRHAVNQCKLYRRKLIRDWQTNVDFRRGKPYASQSDEDRIAVPLDWSLTKDKESLLFSQVPAVRLNHPPQTLSEQAMPWVHAFEQKINDMVIQAGIEAAMTECLPDCINAAGIGIVMVSREAITETVMMPAIDLSILPPEVQMQIMDSGMLPNGEPLPMVPTPREVDSRYNISRISPADFLWPLAFTGSDFDAAPWVGRTGRISWAEAVQMFGLKEEDKSKVLGEGRNNQDRLDRLTYDNETETDVHEEVVGFDEIFYREKFYNPEVKSFYTIHRLVFVEGKNIPVVDEQWKGQKNDEESKVLVGAMKYPIRVLTLAYVTDDAIPPSDTAVGRPMVNEINKARSQMIQQRERSIPVRWFDVNRVDPTIQLALMRGTWQGMIPVQGVGTNIIGEITRAGMHQENFIFDRVAKADLNEAIGQVSPGQSRSEVETKAEVDALNTSMEIRVSRERAKVGKFFVGITEVLGGLISIFEEPDSIGQGFSPFVSRVLAYSILADSTVLLDSNHRLKKIMNFVNFAAKSGWMDIESVLKEAATLSGLDPAVVIRPPEPKTPSEPNISLRLTGTEDMLNPIAVALMMKSGQMPDAKLIEEAKKLIEVAVTPPFDYLVKKQQLEAVPPPLEEGVGPLPTLPGLPPPGGPIGPVPEPPLPQVGEANASWSAAPRINQRVLDGREDVG